MHGVSHACAAKRQKSGWRSPRRRGTAPCLARKLVRGSSATSPVSAWRSDSAPRPTPRWGEGERERRRAGWGATVKNTLWRGVSKLKIGSGQACAYFARNHLARPWAVLPWPMLFVALVYLQRLGQPSHNHGYTLYLSSYRRCSQGHALVAVGTHLASRQPRRGLAARPLHRLYHQ